MTSSPGLILRICITGLLLLLAACAIYYLWDYYKLEPWTRDGRVRADTIQITPDVSGLVTEVDVHDNQAVHRGQLLFVIDRPRYGLAQDQAEANLHLIDVQIAQATRVNRRNLSLGNLVSNEDREESRAKLDELGATRRQVETTRNLAALNLARTEIHAPVDGIVTNIELQPGDYATAGKAAFALIDSGSIRVDGYFEETKLGRIHVGDAVVVTLMGDDRPIHGHVESIAGGIEDHDRASSPRLLANVNPTFNWVRLAQRVPVRISIDSVPAGVSMVTGRTATVRVLERSKMRR